MELFSKQRFVQVPLITGILSFLLLFYSYVLLEIIHHMNLMKSKSATYVARAELTAKIQVYLKGDANHAYFVHGKVLTNINKMSRGKC